MRPQNSGRCWQVVAIQRWSLALSLTVSSNIIIIKLTSVLTCCSYVLFYNLFPTFGTFEILILLLSRTKRTMTSSWPSLWARKVIFVFFWEKIISATTTTTTTTIRIKTEEVQKRVQRSNRIKVILSFLQ